MKIPKAVFCFLLCLTLMISLSFGSVAEMPNTLEWDGKTAMKSGYTYLVTSELYLDTDFTVPKGAILRIREGGALYLKKNAHLTINGIFVVSKNGYVKNSGVISILESGCFDVYGKFESSLSGTINLKSSWTIYNTAQLTVSSTVNIYKYANLYIRGDFTLTKSSYCINSGNISIETNAKLDIQGKMGITKSGFITNRGYITIGPVASIINSGRVALEKDSGYHRLGRIINTKSGVVSDQRPIAAYPYQNVDILVDEPYHILHGIDVSQWQGEINWHEVKESGIDFAMIRAARGKTGTAPIGMDLNFETNIKEAAKSKIHVGVYFYSYATTVEEIKEEARYLVHILKDYEITYPVVLDVEEELDQGIDKQELAKMVDAFFEIVMDAGYYPMLYSYKSWIEQYLDTDVLDKYPVWLAQVNDTVTYRGSYYMWQYSHTGKVKGISGDVDLNVSYRDFASIIQKYNLNPVQKPAKSGF